MRHKCDEKTVESTKNHTGDNWRKPEDTEKEYIYRNLKKKYKTEMWGISIVLAVLTVFLLSCFVLFGVGKYDGININNEYSGLKVRKPLFENFEEVVLDEIYSYNAEQGRYVIVNSPENVDYNSIIEENSWKALVEKDSSNKFDKKNAQDYVKTRREAKKLFKESASQYLIDKQGKIRPANNGYLYLRLEIAGVAFSILAALALVSFAFTALGRKRINNIKTGDYLVMNVKLTAKDATFCEWYWVVGWMRNPIKRLYFTVESPQGKSYELDVTRDEFSQFENASECLMIKHENVKIRRLKYDLVVM